MPDVFDRLTDAPPAPAAAPAPAAPDAFDRISPPAPSSTSSRVSAPPPPPAPSETAIPSPSPSPSSSPTTADVFDRVAAAPAAPDPVTMMGPPASALDQQLRNEAQRNAGDPLENAAIAQRAAADQNVAKWFERNNDLAGYEGGGNFRPGAPDPLRERVASDPFPHDQLRLIDPQAAAGWERRLHQDFARPRVQAAAELPEGWNIPEHLAATWRGEVPAVAEAAGAAGAERGVDVLSGFRAVPGVNWAAGKLLQARTALRDASTENLAQAKAIKQGLPQTPFAGFVTGQANMLGQMGAAAAAGGITGNPAVGAATFSGLFAADSASRAYAEAKMQGRAEGDALQDATFAGIKAAIVARIPMSWPALARETAATRMAGAYLAGTAITTGDAVVDEVWRKAVRGEIDKNPDGTPATPYESWVPRIAEAFLTGGAPAAVLHGAHEAIHAIKNPGPELRTAEPPIERRAGTETPPFEAGDYGPPRGEMELQPIGTLRRLARSRGLDYRLPRAELVEALRKDGTPDAETGNTRTIARGISEEPPADAGNAGNTPGNDRTIAQEPDRVEAPARSDEPAAETPSPETPGEVPQAVKSHDELRRLGNPALQRQAKLWGVEYDARSTTIPRILDAQERWRVGQMTDKQLWDEVRGRGLRAGTRQQNIETLVGSEPEASGNKSGNKTEPFAGPETDAEVDELLRQAERPPAEPAKTPAPLPAETPVPDEGTPAPAGGEGGPETVNNREEAGTSVKTPPRDLARVEDQYALPGTEGYVQQELNREQVVNALRRENRRLSKEQARELMEVAERQAADGASRGEEDITNRAFGEFDLSDGTTGFVPRDVAQRIAGRATALARAAGKRGGLDENVRSANQANRHLDGVSVDTTRGQEVRDQVRGMARKSPAPAEAPAPDAPDAAAIVADVRARKQRDAFDHKVRERWGDAAVDRMIADGYLTTGNDGRGNRLIHTTPKGRDLARPKETPTAEPAHGTIPAETPDALPRAPEAAADDQAGDRRPADAPAAPRADADAARGDRGPRDAGRADVRRADERRPGDGDQGTAAGAEAPDGGEPVVGRAGPAGDAARPEPGDRVPGGRPDEGGDRGRGAAQPDAGGGSDYLAPPGSLKREGSWLETARRNVQIIKLVKQLEAEGRRATPDEQALIAKYTGFGAGEIANGLFPPEYTYGRGGRRTPTGGIAEHEIKPAWRPLYDELKATLSEEEIRTIRRSTQYAHYTSEPVIRAIWEGARRLGFTGGKVLEPGMGTGLFMVAAPPDVAKGTKYVGVEMDHLTAAIAKQLLQTHNVIRNSYIDQKLPDDFFDAAFGNPPFSGRVKVEADPRYRKQRFALHDYFFAKTIDKVRPGGLVVFVTSRYTMDKVDDAARTYLADRADLLGAIRLPQTAFKGNAGTEVVTDVLFLRKRLPGEAPGGEKWMGTDQVQTPEGEARVNQYFADHPDMVLGQHSMTGKMQNTGEPQYTVLPREGDIEQHFADAVTRLPEGAYRPAERAGAAAGGPRPAAELAEQAARTEFDVKGHKEGGVYLAADGTVMQVRDGVGVTIPIALKPKEKAWLAGYVGVRDALKQALSDQLADAPGWEASRAAAVKAYRAHVKEHGRLLEHTLYTRELENADGETETRTYRRFKWNRLLSSTVDADVSTVMGLEKLRDGSNVIDDGDFLSGRVLKPREPATIKGPADALAVSLADRGRLDMEHVAQLLKVKPEEAAEALGNLLYDEPGKGHVTADEYLSGDVVAKLDEAKAAATADPRYARNVEALMKVQPQPLGTDQVLVRLGANWIPPEVVGHFASDVLGLDGGVGYQPAGNLWSLETGGRRAREAGADWGTTDRSAGEILSAVLNNEALTVRFPKERDGSGGGINQQATTAVNEIADRMRDRFAEWFWTDAGRAKDMLALYNRKYNNLAPRNFDGSKMTFPGLSLRFDLHPHQKRAIWRVVQTGNTYLAHAVGAGKTLEMIVSGMEQRRLGLVKKPMYVVPNHMLEQFANEFADAYPAAKVLVADEDNFTGDERKRFVAKAALNDWDAVVIKQSSFKKIGVKPETARAVADDILSELRAALEDTDGDDRVTRKRLEAQIEAVEQRVAKLATGGGEKDNALAFEDLGVDYLYVDEAHLYRKLDFSTNRKVKGIDGSGSGYAFDLFAKLRHLAGKRPDRFASLASGTPITNTLAELYTVQRYLDYAGLRADNLHAFDAWANMFGSVQSEWERNAIGQYEKVERFAKFVNVPELMSRVRRFMDVLTMDQLGQLVKRPDLEGGKPEMRVATPSPALKEYMNGPLKERLEASKRWKPSREEPNNPDPVIAIATAGRLAALDLRLVMPNAANDPKSKLNLMIDRIIERYGATKDTAYATEGKPDAIKGGAQIVFSAVGFGDAMADRGFSPRKWMVKRLTEAGIPSSQVAFMGDYTSDAQKEQLFKDMREGRKRILVGSPKNMGTGVNVQKRLTDLHFLAPPWYPADVEQPHGRILRQGNQNPVARIGWYVTEGTYDSTMWGMIRRKGQAIEQAFRGEGARSVEDISEVSAYTMAEAVASGDNRVIELAELKAKAEKLRQLQQAHHTQQREVAVKVHNLEAGLKDRRRALAKVQASADAIDKVDNWWAPEVRVGGTAYDRPTDAGEALLTKLKGLTAGEDGDFDVASVGGFPVKAKWQAGVLGRPDSWRVAAYVEGTRADLGEVPAAKIDDENPTAWGSRMKRSLSEVRDRVGEVEREAKAYEADIQKFKPRVGAPFERAGELNEAIAAAARLQEELAQANPAPDPNARPADPDAVTVGDGPAPAAPEAPPTGKLDQMESWAKQKLDEMGGTGLRGGIPVDPVNDAKRLALHAVIGAAKIGKGAQRFVTWSRAVLKEIPDLAGLGKAYLRKVWAHARRIHRMKEDDRAAYVMRAFTQGGDEGVMTTLRRAVGLTKDRTAVVSQLDALRGQLRAEQRGATRGYHQGVRDVTGLRNELARIVRENLPPELHGRFLENVAQVRTPGQVGLAIAKARRMLVDHDVRQALSDLEDLTGTLKINVVRPGPRKSGQPKAPRVLGDVDPRDVREVDLKKLPPDVRQEAADLIEQARYMKDRLRAAAGPDVSVEDKQRAADAFRSIDRQLRQVVANHLAAQEIRVGERLVKRDDLVKEIVGAVGAGDEAAARTSDGAAAGGSRPLRTLYGRAALSMDAIATNMVGPASDAYRLTIDDVRRAQSAYHAEQRRTHEAFEPALEAAGIPAGSKKLNDWLTKREAVDVPGVGPVDMTRNEMLDLVAMASDPQTKKLVDQGVRWTFAGNPRETPLQLSPESIDAIRAKLTVGEMGLLDAFRARNAEMTEPAMRAKLELSGWAPTPHEGYYPRSRNRLQGDEAGLPEGWRGYMDRALENTSSTEARAQDKTLPLNVKGFVGRVFSHFDDTAKLIHLAEPVRSAASVWEHPEVTRALGRRYGETMNGRVLQFLRDTMMVRTAPPGGTAERLWQRVARNVARAWLQANPSPMLKNIFGGTVSLMPEFDVQDWGAGVRQMFSGKTHDRMLKGSGVAWERYHGGLYGAYAPLTGGRAQTVAAMTFGEAIKAGHVGDAIDAIKLMEYADSVPLRAAWAASEAFVDRTQPKLKGDARTEAVAAKFERALYRTQNGSSSTEVSGFASAARGNPIKAAYLMFKSDIAKKYSLLAMMKEADGPTRAKTLLAVVLNAMLSAGVGYGLKRGAAAVGRAIGGADEDPDQLEKDRQASLWSGAKDLVGVLPLAGTLMDVARPIALGKGSANAIDNPVLEAGNDVVEGLVKFGQSAFAWAGQGDGAKRDKKYGEMLRALGKLATAGATAGGLPVLPAANLARRAVQAGNYTPPDPRTVKEKAEAQQKQKVRDSLPTPVRNLVTERGRLEQLDRDKLSPAEKMRLARLDLFERQYQKGLRDLTAASAAGDQGAANKVRRDLAQAAAGVDRLPVDERVIDAKDKAHADKVLHDSLPQEVRDLTAEHARLERIPRAQRTSEERARLYRLTRYQTFYDGQVKRLKLARDRGDKALEQRTREALLARAKAMAGQE